MIQLATAEDLIQVYALCTASYIENALQGTTLEISMDKSLATMATCIEAGHVWVDKEDKCIQGLIMIAPSQAWFSTDFFFTAIVFYIKPEHRSLRKAKKLMDKAKEYVIINGIPLAIDIFGLRDVEKKKKLFKYLGFEEWGSSYLYIRKGPGFWDRG